MSTGANVIGANVIGGKGESHSRSKEINLLIQLNKDMQLQLAEQQKMIEELKLSNKQILENTSKMNKHIDFINRSYDKIANSYLFKSVFS